MSEVVKYCLSPMQILDRMGNRLHGSIIIPSDKKTKGISYILITEEVFHSVYVFSKLSWSLI